MMCQLKHVDPRLSSAAQWTRGSVEIRQFLPIEAVPFTFLSSMEALLDGMVRNASAPTRNVLDPDTWSKEVVDLMR